MRHSDSGYIGKYPQDIEKQKRNCIIKFNDLCKKKNVK